MIKLLINNVEGREGEEKSNENFDPNGKSAQTNNDIHTHTL